MVPKEEEPQTDAEQTHAEVSRVETSTQAESSRDGQKRTREVERLLEDARENVGAPSSQRRQRRSPERYTGYMALMSDVLRQSHLLLRRKCSNRFGLIPWWSMTPLFVTAFGMWYQDHQTI